MSELYKWSKNGMKMIINSGFKEFDKQTNLITSGNAICNTQYSSYIRPWSETECNGIINKEGHLFNFDLQYFSIGSGLKNYIKDLNEQVCLYEFYIYKNGTKDIIGWVLERKNGEYKVIVDNKYKIDYGKRKRALEFCKRLIEEKRV